MRLNIAISGGARTTRRNVQLFSEWLGPPGITQILDLYAIYIERWALPTLHIDLYAIYIERWAMPTLHIVSMRKFWPLSSLFWGWSFRLTFL